MRIKLDDLKVGKAVRFRCDDDRWHEGYLCCAEGAAHYKVLETAGGKPTGTLWLVHGCQIFEPVPAAPR